MKALRPIAALLTALCLPVTASVWRTEGHRLIGVPAEVQLNSEARAQVNRLLSPGAWRHARIDLDMGRREPIILPQELFAVVL